MDKYETLSMEAVVSGKVSLLKASEDYFRMVRVDTGLYQRKITGPVTLVPLRMVAAKDLSAGKFGVISAANRGRLHYYIGR